MNTDPLNHSNMYSEEAIKALEILEVIEDAIFKLDNYGQFIYINPQAEELWGKSKKELIGKNLSAELSLVIHPELYLTIRRAENENCRINKEFFLPVQQKWIILKIVPSLTGTLVILQNIHEQKLKKNPDLGPDTQEEKLTESAYKNRKTLINAVFEASQEGIGVFEAVRNEKNEIVDFRWLLANKQMELMTKRSDLCGKLHTEIFPGLKEAGYIDAYIRVIETGEPYYSEKNYQVDGFNNWFAISASKLGDGIVMSSEDITYRKHAEQKLKESNFFIKHVVEATPELITIFDIPSDKIIYANQKQIVQLGLTGEFFDKETNLLDDRTLHPHDKENTRKFIHQRTELLDDELLEHEFRIRTESGEWKWHRIRSKIFKRDDAGNAIQIISFTCNIHDSKKKEEKIQESKNLMEAVFNASSTFAINVISSVRDVTGAIIDFKSELLNGAGQSILQHLTGNKSIIGKKMLQVFPGLKSSGIFDRLIQVVNTGDPADFDIHYTWDGLNNWFHINIVKLGDGVVFILEDITERKKSEEKLRIEHQRLTEVQLIGHIGIFEWNLSTNTSFWSDEMYRIHGLVPQSEVMTFDRVFEFTHPDDIDTVKKDILEAQENQGVATITNRIVRTDGEVRFINRKYECFPDETGKIVRITGSLQDITEQKRADLILDAINEVCFELDKDFNIRYANRKAYDTWKKKPEEVIGKKMWTVFPDNVNTTISEALLKAFNVKEQVLIETYCFVLNKWIFININPSPSGLIVLYFDITEQKLAREELKESKNLLQSVFDLIPDSIKVMEAIRNEKQEIIDFKYILVNQASEKSLGSNIVGKRMITEDKDNGNLDRCIHVVEHGTMNEHTMLINNSGCNKWYYDKIVKFGDSVIIISEDITEQKQAEEKIKQNQKRLQQLIDSLPQITWTAKPDGNIEFYNNRWLEYTGLSFEMTKDFGWQQIVHPDHVRQAYEKWIISIQNGTTYEIEYLLRNAAGKYRWHLGRGVPVKDEKGIIELWIGTSIDIHDHKVAEQEATRLRLSRQKEILNAVLQTQEAERERIGEALHNGLGQLLYAAKLRFQMMDITLQEDKKNFKEINALLEEAISDSRKISFELIPRVLKDFGVVEALATLFRRTVDPVLQLEFTTSGMDKQNENLEMAIYRIVQELVNNIIKHANASQAAVKIIKSSKKIRIKVEDNGTGFDKEKINELHKGLGLQNVKNRVSLLDGTLKIVSKHLKGTAITIEVPCS